MAAGESATRDEPASLLMEVYYRLYRRYGPQHWWPGDSVLEVILGAILTQATSWSSVEKALHNLKSADLLSMEALKEISHDELAALLRPSGFFNAKARKVKALIDHVSTGYGGDLETMLAKDTEELRGELLSIHGIGEETADDILVYAAGRASFVVDSYTRRILKRLAIQPQDERYEEYRRLFHGQIPPDPSLYNEYHALLDRHAKEVCRAQPRCAGCCLLESCPTGAGFMLSFIMKGDT